MIKRNETSKKEYFENMGGGTGIVEIKAIASSDELNEKGRCYTRITLNPGCSIGYHKHEGDSEIYHMLRGTAEYNDNGTVTSLLPGDTAVCPEGSSHGIANTSERPAEFIALVLYE